MESNVALDDNFSVGLSITPDIRNFLHETARWAYFLSILGFIMVGLIIIVAVFAGTFFGLAMAEMQQDISKLSSVFFTIIYLAIAGIYLFPILYLYRFANNTKQALQSDNQIALATAFKNLKSHYKFIGILTLILIGFYALTFMFSLFAGIFIL